MTESVAGIDRWRGGWIIAELTDDHLELSTAETIEPVGQTLSACAVVAIDMPIALARNGRRSAEADIRQVLGSSARSVFTSPTRAAVEALSQAEATKLNRANNGPGISAQAFGLFASIRELRTALSDERFNNWYETHPETSFAAMNGGQVLASKRSALGVSQRLDLLRDLFPDLDQWLGQSPPKVPIDDVLDAIAAAWSARRISAGDATVYGPDGRDDQGFTLGIRV